MSDDPDPPRLTGLDFSPLLRVDGPEELRVVADPGSMATIRFTKPSLRPAPLDGPGYLVMHSGPARPGLPVMVGEMPEGIRGGVARWRPGVLADVDGMAAAPVVDGVVEGVPGWYVPEGATHCPRCRDVNWETPSRRCVTCTDGDDAYRDGDFADGWPGRPVASGRVEFPQPDGDACG